MARVDLGKDYLIDEIRLLPLESNNFQTPGLQSFLSHGRWNCLTIPRSRM